MARSRNNPRHRSLQGGLMLTLGLLLLSVLHLTQVNASQVLQNGLVQSTPHTVLSTAVVWSVDTTVANTSASSTKETTIDYLPSAQSMVLQPNERGSGSGDKSLAVPRTELIALEPNVDAYSACPSNYHLGFIVGETVSVACVKNLG